MNPFARMLTAIGRLAGGPSTTATMAAPGAGADPSPKPNPCLAEAPTEVSAPHAAATRAVAYAYDLPLESVEVHDFEQKIREWEREHGPTGFRASGGSRLGGAAPSGDLGTPSGSGS